MDATVEQAQEAKPHAFQAAGGHAPVLGVGLARLGVSFVVEAGLGASPQVLDETPREFRGVPIVCEVVGRIVPRAAP